MRNEEFDIKSCQSCLIKHGFKAVCTLYSVATIYARRYKPNLPLEIQKSNISSLNFRN